MIDFDINLFIKQAVSLKASDIHLLGGEHPQLRIDGKILKTSLPKLDDETLAYICKSIMPARFVDQFDDMLDFDFAAEIEKVTRLRINIARVFGHIRIVMRIIPWTIKTLEELNIPTSIENMLDVNNGLILLTGATGSGKSTTIASMIDYINKNQQKHILTIEDPIEFVYKGKKSAVSQRQVKVDTTSFLDGIKYALRQDPDIIFIGEIRDAETLSAALNAAETGHLVFSTLHTNGAVQTINRIVNMYQPESREFIRNQLSNVLRGIISQKLIPCKDSNGRLPACEIMINTPPIQDYINRNRLDEIRDLMKDGATSGMTTLNNSIYQLYREDKITQEDAIYFSDNPNEIQQMLRGVYQH